MDRISKSRRSWNMSRIKSKNTGPEIKLRKFLYSHGYRYRTNYNIEGKPDIAFPGKKVAIFVHGCFWHQHGCKNTSIPKTNTEFWRIKLQANSIRDQKITGILKNRGWHVKTIWECRFERSPDKVVESLLHFLALYT